MERALSLSFPQPDVALLTFDLPGKGANVLSQAVLDELAGLLDDLERRTDLAGLVLRSGKPGMFLAGADVREFVAAQQAPREQIVAVCRRGQTLLGRLAQMPFVTVAAIEGVCLGGGAELAIWCDRRILAEHPRTEIGFPEVKLGLFPGWGGTVRLPRLIGLANAVELITSGESVPPLQARALGLADDVVPSPQLLEAALQQVQLDQATGQFRHQRRARQQPLTPEPNELALLGASAAALIQQQTQGHYPAPQAALELMLETCQLPEAEALQREAEGMAQLFGTPVHAALLNVFFLTDRNKRDSGLDRPGVPAAPIGSLGVVGSGIMGSGIAAAALKRELPVALTDASPQALTRGARQALEEAAYDRQAKGPTLAKTLALAAQLRIVTSDEELARCDLVIEAIVEKEEAKKALYARLEPKLAPQAILASNTSTIPISRLAAGLTRPERFCGLHFFNPVRRMQLVEVIRGTHTSDETVATAVAFAKRIGKMPVVVGDGPGFLVNRLLFPYMNEAIELLCEGASITDIDQAATAFGMPMGPLALYDLVGLDTAMYAGTVMYQAFPERVATSPLVPAMVRQGRLGQKSGRGFYTYGKRGRPHPDPDLEPLLASYRRDTRRLSREELTDRLFLPMLLEATRLLEERIVRDVRDVDLGLIYGLGFPAFQGGLLFWADRVGAPALLARLAPLEKLGPRFEPTPFLKDMAARGGTFYPRGGAR